MSLRDSLLPVVNKTRGLMTTLGMRTHRLFVRKRSWSSNEELLGLCTDTDTEIIPRPKIEIDGPRGLRVTKVTPSFTIGGYKLSDLSPVSEAGVDFYFLLLGPDGELRPFRLDAINPLKNLTYELKLEGLDRVVPEPYAEY